MPVQGGMLKPGKWQEEIVVDGMKGGTTCWRVRVDDKGAAVGLCGCNL